MAYDRINWQNEPSEATALNDVNLNKMDSAIYDHDQRLDTAEGNITDLQSDKVDKEAGKGLCTFSALGVTSIANTGSQIADILAIDQYGNQYHNYIKNGVVVDSALSDSSENPIQNKVVNGALNTISDRFTVNFNISDERYVDLDGNIRTYSTFNISEPIELTADLYITGTTSRASATNYFNFYSSLPANEYSFISGYSLPNDQLTADNHKIIIPTNAKYMILSAQKSSAPFTGISIYSGNPRSQIDNDKQYNFVNDIVGKSVVFLGDSITAGQGATRYVSFTKEIDGVTHTYRGNAPDYPNAWEGYPVGDLLLETSTTHWYESLSALNHVNKLKEYLESTFNCTVKNKGCSGIASNKLLENYETWANGFDIVFIMIGTNDRSNTAYATFVDRLRTIVSTLLKSGKKVYLCSAPPASEQNEAQPSRIYHMNNVDIAIETVANEYGIPHISFYLEMLKCCLYTGETVDNLLGDGLHPNDLGYSVMFKTLCDNLKLGYKEQKGLTPTSDYMRKVLPEETATGNPISITDGSNLVPASECAVTMLPIQDLNGYESPWVGGAGKNKLQNTATSGRSGGVDFIVNADGSVTANVPSERPGNAWFPIATGINVSAGSILSGGKSSDIFIQIINSQGTQLYKNGATEVTITEDLTNVTVRLAVYAGIVSQTYTFLPMIRTSGDSTFAPYENICPISGRDSVTVTRTGKNQWDEEWRNGYYNTTGGFVTYANNVSNKNPIAVIPNTTLYLHIETLAGGGFGRLCFYDKNNVFVSTQSIAGNKNYLLTIPYNAYYLNFDLQANYGKVYTHDISINYPSTATAYEPYQGETHTHTYASTVYGGVDDFVSGEGSSTMAMVDLGDITFGRHNTGNFFATLSDAPSATAEALCSKYKYMGIITSIADLTTDQAFALQPANNRIIVRDTTYTSADDFNASTSGVQLCYELATPTTITNTPEDISLLKGVNVLSTDGDSLELKYSGEIQSSSGVNYSTDEQDTGIKWIDGKTIYQKTLTGVMSRGEYEYYFLCIIGTLTNAHLIKSDGVVWNDNNGYQIPINSAGTTNSMPTGDLQTFLYNRAGTLCLTLTQDSTLVGYNYAVTIYYTKA